MEEQGLTYEMCRLRLKNFAHFSNIGLSDFEIDRYGSNNRIITVLGANGSGKSLLASAWTPSAKEATNNRKKPLIVAGEVGVKECDIISTLPDGTRGNYLYKCKVIYDSGTNCSLIRVDRVSGEETELNPNGLLKPYEEKLEQIFGITKNLKNISYLSPQVTSLIEMSPAPRYEYISNWLPDISAYLNAHKSTFRQINSINRQVKLLERDLGNVSLSNVKKERAMKTSTIDSIKSEMMILNNRMVQLETIRSGLVQIERGNLKDLVKFVEDERKTLDKEHKRLIKMAGIGAQYLGKDGLVQLGKDVVQLELELQSVNDQLAQLNVNIDSSRVRLKNIEENIGIIATNASDSESLPEVSKLIERSEDHMISLRRSIDEFSNEHDFVANVSPTLTGVEFRILDNLAKSIKDTVESILSVVSLEKLDNITNYSALADSKGTHYNGKLSDMETRINVTLSRIASLKNTPLDRSILDLAPKKSMCTPKRCGVLGEITNLLSPTNEVSRLEGELEELYIERASLNESIDAHHTESGNMVTVLSLISNLNHSIVRDKTYISYLPSDIQNILIGGIYKIASNRNDIISTFDTLREFISIRDQHDLYVKEIRSLKERESTLRIRYNMDEDFRLLNESIDDMVLSRKTLMVDGKAMIDQHNTLVELKESMDDISTNIASYNIRAQENIKKRDKLKGIAKDWYYSGTISRKVSSIVYTLESLELDLNIVLKEIEKLNNVIATKESIERMKDDLLLSKKDMEILAKAWNPKTGIPGVFINNFLSKIHVKANEYLKSLNGDSLQISRFEIGKNSREFPIVIAKDGDIEIPDVSECSEGQRALVTIAISMAMVTEIIGASGAGYNVIRFDEMDAMLDHNRRVLYVDMIRDKLEEIGSRQALVISHSQEMEQVESDTILLPGANISDDNLINNNILLDVRHIDID